MATGSERPYDCADCGIKGEDRPKGERNFFFTRRVNGNIHWLNLCKSCWRKTLQRT